MFKNAFKTSHISKALVAPKRHPFSNTKSLNDIARQNTAKMLHEVEAALHSKIHQCFACMDSAQCHEPTFRE